MNTPETSPNKIGWMRTPRILTGIQMCPDCADDEFRSQRGGGYVCEYVNSRNNKRALMYMCEQLKSNGLQCWFFIEYSGDSILSDLEVAALMESKYLNHDEREN